MARRDYEKEIREARDRENEQIRKLLSRKDQLAKEVEGTRRSTMVRKAGLAAREAGVRKVPAEWVAKAVQPDPETGEYSVEAVREWAERHRLIETKEDRTPRSVGSAPVPEVPLSYREEVERLKGGRFVPE